mmetsp:Transcript_38429/g.92345  ORF Transcript_38429/g.92345 Transcript_38429/m.92345 type:complete len:284 (+) Transcript_38429:498-1349(+)
MKQLLWNGLLGLGINRVGTHELRLKQKMLEQVGRELYKIHGPAGPRDVLQGGLGEQGVHGVPQLVQDSQGFRGGERGVQAGREPHHKRRPGHLPAAVGEDLRSADGELGGTHHLGSRPEGVQVQDPQIRRAVLRRLRGAQHKLVHCPVPHLTLMGLRMHQRHIEHLHEEFLHRPEDVPECEVRDSILGDVGKQQPPLLLNQELHVPGLERTLKTSLVLDLRQPLQLPLDPRCQRVPGVPQQVLHRVFFFRKMVDEHRISTRVVGPGLVSTVVRQLPSDFQELH